MPTLLAAGIGLLALAGISFSSQRIGLPTLISYIFVGLLVGDAVSDHAVFNFTAEAGIILLFFVLGLHFPVDKLFAISRRVWVGGVVDLLLTAGVVTGLLLLMGVEPIFALFVGGMAYASSSSITLTLLEKRRRLANPEAEFMLALLVFEDLAAPILVSFLGSLTAEGTSGAGGAVLLAYMVGMTAGAVVFARFGFSRMQAFVERNIDEDFMVLLSVGLALGYSGLAIVLGLSEVLGAFLAGIMLAETRRTSDLDKILLPLRNLTLPFFFVHFGASIEIEGTIPHPFLLLLVVFLSVVAKLVVGIVGGRAFGLRRTAALRSGFSLLQRGEFSIVIAAMAPPAVRLFGGIYVIVTALLGVLSFV